MNTKRIVVFGLVFTALLAVGCRLDLDPAGKALSEKTQVELAVTAPFAPLSADAGRAVAPGVNFIYLRTIGGPTGSKGPAYGPYQVPALPGQPAKLTITDLPPGDYSRLMILCSTVPLDTEIWNWNGTSWLFRDLMRVSDAEFLSLVQGNPDEFSVFDNHIEGRATAGELRSVRLLAGIPLRLQLTLRPVCGDATTAQVSFLSDTFSSTVDTGSSSRQLQRRFITLDNLDIPSGKEVRSLAFSFELTGVGKISVRRIAAYDAAGTFLGVQVVEDNVFDGLPVEALLTFNRPIRGGGQVILYIEYIPVSNDEPLTIQVYGALMDIPPPSGTVRVSFTGTAAQANTRLFYRIYDASDIIVSAGILPLDSSGKGNVLARDPETGTAALFPVGVNYRLEGFIDYGHRLYDKTITDITVSEAISLAPDVVDHVINYTFTRGATISVPQNISLAASQLSLPFVTFTDYWYAGQTTKGTGDGKSPSNAMDFNAALSAATGVTPEANKYAALILVETINAPAPTVFMLNTPIVIMGASDLKAIYFSDLPNTYGGSFFTVSAGAKLVLTRLTVNSANPQSFSPFYVAAGAELILGPKSYLSTFRTSVNGGAVSSYGTVVLNGGVLNLNESGIGGAIWAPAGHVFLYHGSINNCRSTATHPSAGGGALYLEDGVTLEITPRAPLQIYGNSAEMYGGAVYQTGGVTTITVNTSNKVFYDNYAKATFGAGGWYMDGTFFCNGVAGDKAPLLAISQNNTSGTPPVIDNVNPD